MTNEVLILLEKSREVFAEHGGLKGMLRDDEGNVCAMGAFSKVINSYPVLFVDEREAYEKVEAVIHEQFPDRRADSENFHIAEFNDHDDTTKDNVLLVFDKAILSAQEIVE